MCLSVGCVNDAVDHPRHVVHVLDRVLEGDHYVRRVWQDAKHPVLQEVRGVLLAHRLRRGLKLRLARESGCPLEFEELANEGFIPKELFEKDNTAEFIQALKDNSQHFENIRKKTEQEGKKLRFTAVYENNSAKVGLQSIGKESPYYQLDGKDNIVLIYSKRYNEQPLIVKGAGAGAEVTASGVFADIMAIANE